ncbi:MAG: YmdB family metallophosphoesterase [Candidatus Gastranaerophilales bacterium]|nr:YmdB family metallophosphoesterase [Candidatus Gastranaerophilales bacterium]
MAEVFKILFIGDIVGRSGREVVKRFLIDENKKEKYDFIIANVENASHGFGLTQKNHDELLSYGINAMTSGNHIWDKKDIVNFIDESPALIRPYNYHKDAKGAGYKIFNNKIIVINLLGKTFMPPIDCPFKALKELIEKLNQETNLENKIIFVDFHAEATAEKICLAKYAANLGIKAVIGTHTHTPTADNKIIENKCAYQTDVGFCGSTQGVIGMEYESSLKRLITSIPERFEVETSYPYILNACEIEFINNCATSINRISFEYSENEEKESED